MHDVHLVVVVEHSSQGEVQKTQSLSIPTIPEGHVVKH